MIIVDSNVASEMMAGDPSPQIVAWLDRITPEELWLNAITVFEIKGGIDDMPNGRRKRALLAAFDHLVVTDFANRVLPFDFQAAMHAARIDADRNSRGRPAGFADTQIAGIAVSRGAAIATRNVRHFADLTVDVIDPWTALT
jgi:toxin FitB